MIKKRFSFSALLIMLLVSVLLTGCTGSKDDPRKDILNLTEKLVRYWYQDAEEYTKLFDYPMEVWVYGREDEDDEDIEFTQRTFADALRKEWPKKDDSYSTIIEIDGSPKIFVASDNKEAIVEFYFKHTDTWTWIDENGQEQTDSDSWNSADDDWYLTFKAKKNSAGKWLFQEYPGVIHIDHVN